MREIELSKSDKSAVPRPCIFSLVCGFLLALSPVAGFQESLQVMSAASREAQVAPDSLAIVSGKGFLAESIAIEPWQVAAPPEVLGGIRVLMGGIPARIIHITPEEIYCVTPAGLAEGEVETVVIRGSDDVLARGKAFVSRTAPALFSEDNTGRGPGRIYDAATRQRGPFRVRNAGSMGDAANNRIVLAATGLRQLFRGESSAPAPVRESVKVVFLLVPMDGWVREFSAIPDEIRPDEGYAGLDDVVVTLPSELDGLGAVLVTLESGGKRSNAVGLEVLFGRPPVILSVGPAKAAPGQVLEITGAGFSKSLDGRNRVILDAGEAGSAVALPLEASVVGSAEGSGEVVKLKAFVPLLAQQGNAWAGPARLCVETDGLRGCAQSPVELLQPQAVNTPPGDLLISTLERIYDRMEAEVRPNNPELADKYLALKAKARSELRARIDAALAGTPEKVELVLPDGERVEGVFDLEMIRRTESVLTASLPELETMLASPEAGPEQGGREAVDWDLEEEVRTAFFNYSRLQDLVRLNARVQFAVAGGALASCLLSGVTCLPLAAALSAAAPLYAAHSLLQIAGMMNIEMGPNTLAELRVSPPALELRPGETSSFDVRGRFVSRFDAAAGTEYALKQTVATVVGNVLGQSLGFGFSLTFLAEKFLSPVFGYIADELMDLGLRNVLRPTIGTSREIGLSWQTVNSTCIRGSSPSPGVPFFLGSWEVRAFSPMSSPQQCLFAPRAGAVLLMPGAQTPVTATIRVLSAPADVAPNCWWGTAWDPAQPLFTKIHQITAPNANGDRLVLGEFPPDMAPGGAYSFVTGAPLPAFPNQMFCRRLTLATGCTAEVYLPTRQEKDGDYSNWPDRLINPFDGRPFPANMISRIMMGPGGLFGLRVKSLQGCGN